MATEIYNQVVGQQNFTMGATVSVVLLIPALVAVVVDRMVQPRQYALIGAAARPLVPRLRPLADGLLPAYCGLVAAAIAAVYAALLVSSLVRRWAHDLTPTLKPHPF